MGITVSGRLRLVVVAVLLLFAQVLFIGGVKAEGLGAVTVSGHVYDEQGAPVENVLVHLFQPGGVQEVNSDAVTNSEGYYSMVAERPLYIGINRALRFIPPPDSRLNPVQYGAGVGNGQINIYADTVFDQTLYSVQDGYSTYSGKVSMTGMDLGSGNPGGLLYNFSLLNQQTGEYFSLNMVANDGYFWASVPNGQYKVVVRNYSNGQPPITTFESPLVDIQQSQYNNINVPYPFLSASDNPVSDYYPLTIKIVGTDGNPFPTSQAVIIVKAQGEFNFLDSTDKAKISTRLQVSIIDGEQESNQAIFPGNTDVILRATITAPDGQQLTKEYSIGKVSGPRTEIISFYSPPPVDSVAPTVSTPTYSANPKPVNGTSYLSAAVTDDSSGVAGGEYFIGNSDPGQGNGTVMNWNGSSLSTTFGTNIQPGVYKVNVRAKDNAGNWSSNSVTYLTVQATSTPQTFILNPSADTYVRSGQSNRNQGGDTSMLIQSSGQNRGLIRFDQSAIQSTVGGGEVTSAKLRLKITDNGNNWGTTGRTVDVHRLLVDWAEGNGTDSSRGTGAGATWDCAVDSNIANQAKDCAGTTLWEMGQPNNPLVHPWLQSPTASQTITNNQSGTVEYDVTSDVQAFLNGTANYGWLIRKTNEGQSGQVSFGTKEGSNFVAELVITYQGYGTQPPASY